MREKLLSTIYAAIYITVIKLLFKNKNKILFNYLYINTNYIFISIFLLLFLLLLFLLLLHLIKSYWKSIEVLS